MEVPGWRHPRFHHLERPVPLALGFQGALHWCTKLSFRRLACKDSPSGYSKSVCVRLHSENSDAAMLISQTSPDKLPPTPPPCRWQTLITLPTLAKVQLVWRRLCGVVLFHSSGLFKHTLTAVCALPELQSCKYSAYSNLL